MSYRTPENLIRQIMAEGHAPALKVPEPDRVADALKALSDNGVTARKKDDNTIEVDPADTEKAINIMNNSFFHGKTTAAPQIVSSNSIDLPEYQPEPHKPVAEPHPPEGGQKLGEESIEENTKWSDLKDTQDYKHTHTSDGHKLYSKGNTHFLVAPSGYIHSAFEGDLKDIKGIVGDADNRAKARTGLKPLPESNEHLDDEPKGEEYRDVENVDAEVCGMNVQLQKRSIVNRMENQLKKIDENATERDAELDALIAEATAEDLQQLDELSKNTINKYLHKSWEQQDELSAKDEENKGRMEVKDIKRWNKRQRGEASAYKALDRKRKAGIVEDVEQIDEISYSTLKKYEMSARKSIETNPSEKRSAGLEKVKTAKIEKVRRAAFAEEKAAALNTVTTIVEGILLNEASGLRLKATIHSDCGKHSAKVYKDHEWGEHRVKFFINGKHHEPADYHTSDYEDAHGTARLELNRMTKLNGALKESTEEEIQSLVEDIEQIDELSKALLGRYVVQAARSKHNLGVQTGQDPDKSRSASFKKTQKRTEGISTAASKLSGAPAPVPHKGIDVKAKVPGQ